MIFGSLHLHLAIPAYHVGKIHFLSFKIGSLIFDDKALLSSVELNSMVELCGFPEFANHFYFDNSQALNGTAL